MGRRKLFDLKEEEGGLQSTMTPSMTILEDTFMKLCFISLFITTLLCWSRMITSWNNINYLSRISMILSHMGITGSLIIRWILSNHPPFSNLYESSIFLSWSLTLAYILLHKKIQSVWLGGIIAPSAMFTYCFATLGLPITMQQSVRLVPALQSNWLIMHVSTMILSYGALLIGCLFSVALLVINYDGYKTLSINRMKRLLPFHQEKVNDPLSYHFSSIEEKCFHVRKISLVDQLDYWSYRTIGTGFPLLTIGILSGAVWANEAWGSYWSWDPKETWAFITWLIFAVYLHTRMTKGWNGAKLAWVASLGFCIVWTCYLGVNLLGKGLHSYGWLN